MPSLPIIDQSSKSPDKEYEPLSDSGMTDREDKKSENDEHKPKYTDWIWNLDKSIITLVDSKTQLQEYSLKKFKELPKYIFHKKTGPQHKPLFKTEVQIPNSKKVSGTGYSKKNAQQNAASKLLRILKT